MELFIITDKNTNQIMYICSDFETGNWPDILDGETLWKLTHINGAVSYSIPTDMFKINETEILLDDIPEDLESSGGKYCYTPAEGIYQDPNWIPPKPPVEDRIEQIRADIDFLSIMTGFEV